MSRKVIEHRDEDSRVVQAGAQRVGGKAGEGKQPPGPRLVREKPPKRRQRQRVRVGLGGGFANDCQVPSIAIERDIVSRRWVATAGPQVAKRILVVEDNDLNRKLFCDLLKANGFAVETVGDGRDAIERSRQFVPNLVIMDIQLPNVSGLELIEAMKRDKDLRPIPVLAVTAYAGKGDEERIRQAGAEGYLAKPVSIGPFMDAVRKLI